MNIFNKFKRNKKLPESNITYMTIIDSFPIKDFGGCSCMYD